MGRGRRVNLIIQIEDLRYTYPQPAPGQGRVLNGVNLGVHEGEFLALMGPSGAGKSTLCLTLNGIVPHALGGKIGGRVLVNSHDTRESSIAELARTVAMVFQNPESQLFMASVEQEVAFGPENLALPRKEIRRRVDQALAIVGMSGFANRAPQSLSGGEMQRVAIAAALSLEPRVLVLDEPTTNLDPLGQQQVLRAIDTLRRELGTTIVMTSQNAEWVAEFSDRTAVLAEGRVTAVGPTEDILNDEQLINNSGLLAPQVTRIGKQLGTMQHKHYAFARYRDAMKTLEQAPQ